MTAPVSPSPADPGQVDPASQALDRLDQCLQNPTLIYSYRARDLLATVRGEIERLRTYINTDGLVVSTEQAKVAVDKIDAFLAGVGGRGAADLALVTVRRVLLEQERENERLREERDMARAGRDQAMRDAKGRGVVQYELLDRAKAAEAELERLRRHPDAWSQEAFDQQKARADAAEAEVRRLTEGLREIKTWFETKPWEGSPDPGSFGGRPYTTTELSLGYGTYRDPRFLPALLAESPADAARVPAGETTLNDDNPASVVGVPWNEDGYVPPDGGASWHRREPGVRTEFAWLIERGQPEGQAPTVWLNTSTQRPDWYGDWTQDANQATKFPTRESAEWHMRDARIPSARAVEHGWFGRVDQLGKEQTDG